MKDDFTEFADENDFIRIALETPELDYPIQLPLMKKAELNVDYLLSEVERVLQSQE